MHAIDCVVRECTKLALIQQVLHRAYCCCLVSYPACTMSYPALLCVTFKCQSGEFLDMAELLPDHLGVSTTPKHATSKEQEVSSDVYTGVSPMLWHIHRCYSGKAPRHRHVICYHFSTQFISYLDGIVLCLIPRHHLARILLPVCTPLGESYQIV